MSKHLFSFLLSELSTVRVLCRHCQGVVELPLEKLGTRLADGACPLCKRDLLPRGQEKALLDLDNAIAAIREAKHLDVEFIIPAPPNG